VALQTLGEDAGKALAWFAGAIRSAIAAGDSFADALERHPTIIEPTHIAWSGPARHRESLMWCYARSSRIARGGSCLPNGSCGHPLSAVSHRIGARRSDVFLIYVVPQI